MLAVTIFSGRLFYAIILFVKNCWYVFLLALGLFSFMLLVLVFFGLELSVSSEFVVFG